MGRKPKPTSARRLAGNPSGRPLNEREPEHPTPTADAFDAVPPELTGAAALEWQRLAPLLRRARQVAEVDRNALIACCLEWARYIAATAHVEKRGMVVTTKNGYPMLNPFLVVAGRALGACNKLWAELGLTPSSRSRVETGAPFPGEIDEFSEFDPPVLPDARKH